MPHGLDTETQVFFYEQEFYVLSNFSAFAITWKHLPFPTVEHAYHWEKLVHPVDLCETYTTRKLLDLNEARRMVRAASSAHDAFLLGQDKSLRRPDWDEAKEVIMYQLLHAKAAQHEYVRRKLLETGDRELIENSWRDDFWGWGPNRNGRNMLGRLWMEVRRDLREAA